MKWLEKAKPLITSRSKADKLKQYREETRRLKDGSGKRIQFGKTPLFFLAGPHAICAPTGNGKTEFLANQTHWTLQSNSQGKVYIILNEEWAIDFIHRVALLSLGLPTNLIKCGSATPEQEQAVEVAVEQLIERVEILPDSEWNFNSVEDVENGVAATATKPDALLVIVDYLQNITTSKGNPTITSVEISKKFGSELKEIGKKALVPILVGMQIRPGEMDSYQNRIQNDRTISNHMLTVLEIAANFESSTSEVTVRKSRWGENGAVYTFKHKNGAFTYMERKK